MADESKRGDPTVMELVLDRINAVEKNLNQRLDGTEKTFGERFDRQDNELREIKTQTQKTNGRVTVLEKARERAQGFMFAFRWMPIAFSAALTAGVTILLMALTGALK